MIPSPISVSASANQTAPKRYWHARAELSKVKYRRKSGRQIENNIRADDSAI